MRYIDFSSVKETIGKIYFGICICVFAYAPGYKCYTWIGILLSTDLRIIGMINHFLWIIRKAQINKRL